MASGVRALLLLDQLVVAGRLLEGGEPHGRRPPGRSLLDAGAAGGRESGGAAEQSAEEERAEPPAALRIHEAIVGSKNPCSARWAISSST
jgi:hypothetical protein